MDQVEVLGLLGDAVEDFRAVVDDGARPRGRAHALEDVGTPDGAARGNAGIDARHLKNRHEQVALADGEVRAVATLPRARVVGRGVPVVPLPLGIRHAPRPLGRQVDTRRGAKAPLSVGLLQTLGVVGIEEAHAHLVEDHVTGIGDARLERHGAVTVFLPAVLAIFLTEAGPPARTVKRGVRRGKAVV